MDKYRYELNFNIRSKSYLKEFCLSRPGATKELKSCCQHNLLWIFSILLPYSYQNSSRFALKSKKNCSRKDENFTVYKESQDSTVMHVMETSVAEPEEPKWSF